MTDTTRKSAPPVGRGRRRGAAAPPLSRDSIVDAAIELINRDGSAEFSMRSLANHLGVYPTALYWHTGDRAELLSAIGARWMTGIVPEYRLDDWETWARDMAHNYRAACHREPHVAHLLGSHILNDGGSVAIVEGMTAHLLAAGVPEADLVHTYNALAGSLVGFVDIELARPLSDTPRSDEDELGVLRARVNDADHPNLAPRFDQFAGRAFSMRWTNGVVRPMDETFETLLDILLAGVRARIPDPAKRKH
jgi:AcrR family transcriptional regulator